MDDQVKVNGFRIELAEIENVYSLHDAVDQAVAVVRDNALAIYLKPAAGFSLNASELSEVQTFASRSLTYYMIPK